MRRGPDGCWFCPDCGLCTKFRGDREPRHECVALPVVPPRTTPCRHFGPPAGTVPCEDGCRKGTRLKVNECLAGLGVCRPVSVSQLGVVACLTCDGYEPVL